MGDSRVKLRESGVYVGVILDVEGQEVKLIPNTAINRMEEDGFELEYPEDAERIRVKPENIINGIAEEITGTELDIVNKVKEAKIPFLTPIANKILTGTLTFEKIHYKMPSRDDRNKAIVEINSLKKDTIKDAEKTDSIISSNALESIKNVDATAEQSETIQKGQTSQTFSMSLVWQEENESNAKIGGLSLKGVYLGITNETGEGEYGNNLFNLEKRDEVVRVDTTSPKAIVDKKTEK